MKTYTAADFDESIRKNYYKIYLAVFSVVFFFAFIIWHILDGKSFIVEYDSFDQHYMGFVYIGKWLRNIARSLIFDHRISIPLWDISIGYGSDIIATLPVYFCDPFNWISMMIPAKYAEYAFEAIIAIKIFLCGITFSKLSLEKGNSPSATLCGAITYAFAASVYIGFLQTIFLNVMFAFPLVILGAERIWKKEDPRLYIMALSFVFITYFYCAYMVCILVFLYCVLRFLNESMENRTREEFIRILKSFSLYSLLAAGISMAFMLPSIIQLANTGRIGTDYYVPVVYEWDRYIDFIVQYFSCHWTGMDSYFGISAISAPCLIALFAAKGRKFLKSVYLSLTVGVLLPYFGYLMNGFGYATNRWIWAYSLCVSYIVASMLSELRNIRKLEKRCMMIFCLLYGSIMLFFPKRDLLETILILAVLVLCLLFSLSSDRMPKKTFWVIAVILTSISVTVPSAFFFYSGFGFKTKENFAEYQIDAKKAYDYLTGSAGLSILDYEQRVPEKRYDVEAAYDINQIRNSSWFYGISGINFYVSIYNENIDDLHNKLGLLTGGEAYSYKGLNRRSELEALMGVDHYIITQGNDGWLPYGYRTLEAEGIIDGRPYQSYAGDAQLSLMYLFDKSISEEEFDKLTPVQRQQALLQAVVVKEPKTGGIDEMLLEEKEVPYSVISIKGATITADGFTVNEPGSEIMLEIPEIADAEIYIWFDNIRFLDNHEGKYTIEVMGVNNVSEVAYEKAIFHGLNNHHHMYGGKTSWLLNLGHSQEPTSRIRIIFYTKGEYAIEDLKIYSREKESIEKMIDGLVPASNHISVECNRISAAVTVPEQRTLLLTIPYSSGWRAYVDGTETEVMLADEAFISIHLDKGEHGVVFRYFTPGLKPGLIISGVSLMVYLFLKKKQFVKP